VCDWERKRLLTCGVKGGQEGRELVGARTRFAILLYWWRFPLTGYEILTVEKFNSYLIFNLGLRTKILLGLPSIFSYEDLRKGRRVTRFVRSAGEVR
jgi:hypothetical protein